MLDFFNEKGARFSGIAEVNETNAVNGEKSISGVVLTNDTIIHGIAEGWKLQFNDETYVVTYAVPIDNGKQIETEFDAVHQFFFDFDKSSVYEELNGSNTMDAYLQFIFKDSGYLYRLESTVGAFEKESFGLKSRLELFKDVIKSSGLEFVVSGKVVRLLNKVGSDLSTIVKKGFNLQELRLEKDIKSFVTYQKGYGAYFDEDDHSKGRLEMEYLSPLAAVYGKLEAQPLVDERYKVQGNLFDKLKVNVDNSYEISVQLTMEDLTNAGYNQKLPVAGDYIMGINEDLDFKRKIRIVSFKTTYDIYGKILTHDVTCNSIGSVKKASNNESQLQSNVNNALELAEKAKQQAEEAAISANGKNMIFWGLFPPNGEGEPVATKPGDMWYKPNGEEEDLLYWNGAEWRPYLDKDVINKISEDVENLIVEAEQLGKDVDAAMEQADKAIEGANKAVSEANKAASDAGFAKSQAEQAQALANNVNSQLPAIKADAKAALDAYNNLEIGGRNWLQNSESPFFSRYNGSTDTVTFNQTVAEWRTTNAVRQVMKPGTGLLCGTLRSTVQNLLKYNTNYIHSIYIKNNGASKISITNNGGIDFWVQPGESKRVVIKYFQNEVNRNMQFLLYGSVLTDTIDIFLWHAQIEEGTEVTDWSPAPEDVQVQITNINGELSSKVTQTQFNLLQGTVTSQGTQINQNKNDIALKANQSTVNTLTGRVTAAESTLTVQSSKIEGLVTKTDGQTSQITQLQLKADGLLVSVGKVEQGLIDMPTSIQNRLFNSSGNNEYPVLRIDGKDYRGNSGATVSFDGEWVKCVGSNNTTGQKMYDIGSSAAGISHVGLSKYPFNYAVGDEITFSGDLQAVKGFVNLVIYRGVGTSTWAAPVSSESVPEGTTKRVFVKTTITSDVTALLFRVLGQQSVAEGVWKFKNVMVVTKSGNTVWNRAPEDMATQTQYASLEVKFNGIQATVAGKADQSQVTQLSGQITSVVSDVKNINDLSLLSDSLMLHKDPEFRVGLNSMTVYNNNSTTGTVTVVREASTADTPTESTHRIKITSYGTPSPGWGGFLQGRTSRANAVYIHKFTALVPVGRRLDIAANSTGTGSSRNWLTPNVGTGKWEEYAYIMRCGTGGTFSSFGFVYLSLGTAPTQANPLIWYVARSSMYDVSQSNQTQITQLTNQITLEVSALNASKADKSQITVLQDQINLRVTTTTYNAGMAAKADVTQITLLQNQINLKVQQGDVVAQLNIEAGKTLISNKSIVLAASTVTFTGSAFIPAASIVSLNADKITAGTINAANINLINLNASNITTGTLTGPNLSINLITGVVTFQKGVISGPNMSLNVTTGVFETKTSFITTSLANGVYTVALIESPEAKTTLDMGYVGYGSRKAPRTNFYARSGPAVPAHISIGVSAGNGGYDSTTTAIYIDRPAGNSSLSDTISIQGTGIAIGKSAAISNNVGIDTKKVYVTASELVYITSARVTLSGIVTMRNMTTTSAAANMHINSTGDIYKVSSSLRYKANVSTAVEVGRKAEQLLTVDVRQWKDIEEIKRGDTSNWYYGYIAEELSAAGLTEVVVYDSKGRPDSIAYDRLSIYQHELIKKLWAKVKALEGKIIQTS